MLSRMDDFKHWSAKAEEARAIAAQFSDPKSNEIMLRIAKDYDDLAHHAKERVTRGQITPWQHCIFCIRQFGTASN